MSSMEDEFLYKFCPKCKEFCIFEITLIYRADNWNNFWRCQRCRFLIERKEEK